MNRPKEEEKEIKHKIFIVDDHPIVRRGITQLINQEPDFIVSGEASDIASALQAISTCDCDLVIVDLSLGQDSGIRLIEEILLDKPDMKILILSMHDEFLYAERCFRSGAKGYIMKQEPPEQVIAALKVILDGEVYISDNLSSRLLNKLVSKQPATYSSPIEQLSNRELEVFQLIGKGLKTRKIADQLNLSVKTIETYIDHIKRKMNLEDSRDLIQHAVQWGISEKPPSAPSSKPPKK
jgi:DNA-binding NarL/FixJ family response regulator